MVRKLPIRVILTSAVLMLAAPLAAAGTAAGDLTHRLTATESSLRARLSADGAHAPQLRLALARLAMLRANTAALRHTQGGVLSRNQQDRALDRLAAITQAQPDRP